MLFSVYTLGCKLNQLETEAITDSFCREGFSLVPWDTASPSAPWLMIINTCTVTSMAEQKARRFIRRQLRQHPAMCIIITGCYAQLEEDALAALDETAIGQSVIDQSALGQSAGFQRRLFVIPGDSKDRLLDLPPLLGAAVTQEDLPNLVEAWLAGLSRGGTAGRKQGELANGSFRFQPENFASHSRAFLKVQDGCDRRCAYCRVSIARGKSRSLGAGEALKALKSLEERGFAEAVIAGVNITQYRDTDDMDLAGLIEFLLSKTETIRLRLSSIEPDWLTPARLAGFTQVLANPRIRSHFHLSVQSGSAGILAKMGRDYSPEHIEETVTLLRSVRPDPFLACDIIAGFPGETEEEFEKTYALVARVGFAWIHAFPFSPRPGTSAYDFLEKVSERDAARRVEQLTELARKGRREYITRWEGKEVEAIIEAGKEPAGPMAAAVSENYLKLLVDCGPDTAPAPGSLIRCRILGGQPPETARFDALAKLSS